MVRVRQFSFLAFIAAIAIAAVGCASQCKYKYSDAPAGEVYFGPAPDFQSEASLLKWSGAVSENEKIDYLLDRIAASDFRFIRNGEPHDGKLARRWLLYKMNHWVSGVDTAEEFVNRVAARSEKTGEPYLVEFKDGKLYSLKSVLQNELFLLEKRPDRSKGVSLSPTAIAATAVASTVRPSNS